MNISYSLFRNIGIRIITVSKYQACHLVHFEDFSISTEFLYPNTCHSHYIVQSLNQSSTNKNLQFFSIFHK